MNRPTPTIVILRTTSDHMRGVVDHQKHASKSRLKRADPGALLLVAEVQPKGPAVARYAMWLKNQRADNGLESDAIWGNHWNFIIEGEDGHELTTPFAPGEVKPSGPYLQGGPFVYVEPEDAEDFRQNGFLAPLL